MDSTNIKNKEFASFGVSGERLLINSKLYLIRDSNIYYLRSCKKSRPNAKRPFKLEQVNLLPTTQDAKVNDH